MVITTFWKNFIIGLVISMLFFAIVAKIGADYVVDAVQKSVEKDKDDKLSQNVNQNQNDGPKDISDISGTYSFAVFITEDTYLSDFAPPFDGYTYDSIIESEHMQYSKTIRYICAVTFDSSNRQIIVDTMVGNILVPINNVSVPLDYTYYLARTGSNGFTPSGLAEIAGTYTGLNIDNYFFAEIDVFSEITNYCKDAKINIPEAFVEVSPVTGQNTSVFPGEQPLTYEILYMLLKNDSYVGYEGVCNAISNAMIPYLRSILHPDKSGELEKVVNRLRQKTNTDLTVSSLDHKNELLFSSNGFEAHTALPSATLKKYGNDYYYSININESISNIKKYYNKSSS